MKQIKNKSLKKEVSHLVPVKEMIAIEIVT